MAAVAGQFDGVLEACLDAPEGVHQQDRRVGAREALDHFGREVRVSGSVDDLDARPLGLERGNGKAQRLMPLLLFGLEVHARRAVIDTSEPAYRTGVEEEALCQRRLARAGVGGYDDAAEVGEVGTLGCHRLSRSFVTMERV